MKVERHQKQKGSARSFTNSSNKWGSKWNRFEEKKKEKSIDSYEKGLDAQKSKEKGTSEFFSKAFKHRDVKCFKCQGRGHYGSNCPNKKVMYIKGDEIVSGSENENDCEGNRSDDSMPPLVDASSDEENIEYPVKGESLVVRRVLNSQVKEESLEQRENIFNTRCLIGGKMCSMIIDGGSCANVASTTLVEKLWLKCAKHPTPYRLQWLNDSGEVRVTKQVVVSFSIGRYADEVVCDVVPMQASHLLLGRPWQFDRRVLHDRYKNRYSFELHGQKFTLALLSPKEVYLDQVKLQRTSSENSGSEVIKKEERKEAKREKKNDKGPTVSDYKMDKKNERCAGEKMLVSENKKKSEQKEKGVGKENEGSEKVEKQHCFYAKERDLKSAYLGKRALILIRLKEVLFSETNFDPNLPSVFVTLLQEYCDVFPEEVPHGLPPFRGIDHQIDFVPGAQIPPHPAYRSNPEETKELQRQVDELL
ncbi:hypothetical protein H6P81_007234 [Aristolochia fimbriata]|uniref:CCHC-type domain-containing protein n=1 Tax=Aristolochia fimbriata TaxID=158543 RepID=A0AAV7F1T5_ARIFI|nr:hypothetical protein H6P81_007234 [Aristolochia fimbriata]